MANEYIRIQRSIGPIYDENSKILILGSFPSVKSREQNFYYGHPHNRFWPLMARLLESPVPETREEKTRLLLSHGIALWDSIDSCDIIASSDSSIKNAVPVDIMRVLGSADIRKIFANGAAAAKVYDRYLRAVTGREIIALPSTSPANAAWQPDRLYEKWREVLQYL